MCQIVERSQNKFYVYASKHKLVFVFVFVFVSGAKINFVSLHKCGLYYFVAGAGGCSQHTNQLKTKHCSHLCPLICWPPTSKKKSLPGAGGVFLARGKWEAVAPVQG